jgi:hypothetical protein
MLLTKPLTTTLKSRQYGADVVTQFNFNTFVRLMTRLWVVTFAISVTQNRVTALQRKANK